MEVVTEMVKEIVVPVVKYALGFVKQQIGYMICYKARVEEMKSNIDSLKDRRDTIQDQVEADGINSVPIKDGVRTWLGDAEKTLEKAKRISENEDAVSKGCLNLKQRYFLGKRASQELQEINNLRQVELDIILSKNQIPLGKVGGAAVSEKAVQRFPSIVQKDGFAVFGSRAQVYGNVLKALDDDKTRLMAICGMGGVGKTTMIEQLEKTANEKHMFDWAFKAVVTAQPNMRDIQQEIADFMKLNFDVTSVDSRAERLGEAFKKISEDGRKKILVILDDLWGTLDLKQLGLSPVAFTTVGFKIIFTTRNKHVCTGMNVDDDAIFELGVLKKEEASDLFQKTVDIDNCTDPELPKIAEEIVEECAGLPLAITTIAGALKRKSKSAWIDTLRRLRNSDIGEKLNAVLETSFKYLEDDDTREVFQLCCLFPEDYHIPIKELARYAIGLRLYKDIHLMDMEDVRNRTKTCTEELTGVNFLLESEYEDCVKMHDIVRDFGVNRCKKTWLVKHGNILQWPRQDSDEPYKRISLECSHMDQLPSKMNCPNLELLKLTGNPSSEFPKEFYKGMKKLRVLDYQGMNNPLLPGWSLQVFTNLRTLTLSSCNLGDFSMIGNLKCLEILSFADCGVSELPAEIGNLSQLKLLDLTGCMNLHIEEGVLQKLVKLEELYMRSAPLPYSVYKLTDSNCVALHDRFEKLTALEFEFYKNKVEARPAFFKKLKRFRISIGCHLDGKDIKGHIPFKNALMLKTNESELIRYGIRELFKMTEELVLAVEDMNCICNVSSAEDLSNLRTLKVKGCNELVHLVDTEVMRRTPQPQHSFFRMLKELELLKCNKLKFILSHSIVKGMSMLARLTVKSCNNMEEIMEYESGEEKEIMVDIESRSSRVVEFPNLRFLYLYDLPNLVNFCKTGGAAIQFPQLEEFQIGSLGKVTSIFQDAKRAVHPTVATDFKSLIHPLFHQKVALPKLRLLNIEYMENLREIWGSQYRSKDINLCVPREIKVRDCDTLEVIFDLDFGDGNNNNRLDCHETKEEEEGCSSSRLRNIEVFFSRNVKHIWRMKQEGVNSDQIISLFKTMTSIKVSGCHDFIHLFTPSTANINLESLESIEIEGSSHLGRSWSHDQLQLQVEGSSTGTGTGTGTSTSVQEILCETSQRGAQAIAIAFPSYLSHRFHNLQVVKIDSCMVDIAFEIGELISGGFWSESKQVLLPRLRELELNGLYNMSHVWKWKKLVPHQLQLQLQLCIVGFQNLTSLKITSCDKIKYLFSPWMAKHMVGLQNLEIRWCEEMQTIVSDKEDDDNGDEGGQEMVELSTEKELEIVGADASLSQKSCRDLGRIKHAQLVSFPNLRELSIHRCPRLPHAIPSYAAGQLLKLEILSIVYNENMVEVFEMEELNNTSDVHVHVHEGIDESMTLIIPRLNKMDLYQLPNLTEMTIESCDRLRYLFTFSIVGSLKQLKELKIKSCLNLVATVKEEDGEHDTNNEVVRLPCLRSLTLDDLQSLEAFSMRRNDFEWPLLDEVKIINCPRMRMFTRGLSYTPQLKYVYTRLGKHSHEGGHLNFNTTTTTYQTDEFPSADSDSKGIEEHLQFPCSLSNLIEVNESYNGDLLHIFSLPFNELTKLQQLENIHVEYCGSLVGVFEVVDVDVDGTSDGMNERVESESVVKFPKLREMSLECLEKLEYIWKSQKWTVLEFTNLTKLSIEYCGLLKHVFTYSTVASFVHLQELEITGCDEMEAIITEGEENEEEKEVVEDKDIVFPELKYLKLDTLPRLKGFCMQKYAFKWPSLDTLVIKRCPKITVFTSGNSNALKLKVIDTDFGLCYVKEDPNTFITRKKQQGFEFVQKPTVEDSELDD